VILLKSATKELATKRSPARLLRLGLQPINSLRGLHGRRGALALVDQLLVGGANFLTILALGHFAGPSELGGFALVMTTYYLCLAVQESLITVPYTMLMVHLNRTRQRQYAGATLCQSAAWSACVGVVLGAVSLLFFMFRDDANLAIDAAVFALVAPLLLVREFGRRYLFAHMQVAKVVAMSVVGVLAQLVVLGTLMHFERLSAATALFAMGVGGGLSGFGRLWLSRGGFEFSRRRCSYFMRKNWVTGRWLLACQGMGILAENTMPWLVWFWLGPIATGLFAACDTLIRFANPVIMSLNNVFTPRIAVGLHQGGKAELNRIVWKATGLLTLFLCIFCLGLAVAGEWVLDNFFGKSYEGLVATLVVLGINQLVGKNGLTFAPSGALWLLQRANILVFAMAAGLGASLLAAPLLFAHYASLGAALALLAGSLVYSAITFCAYNVQMRGYIKKRFAKVGAGIPSTAPPGSVLE
jgi:O-antigen/teichoic acid export membrane protein